MCLARVLRGAGLVWAEALMRPPCALHNIHYAKSRFGRCNRWRRAKIERAIADFGVFRLKAAFSCAGSSRRLLSASQVPGTYPGKHRQLDRPR